MKVQPASMPAPDPGQLPWKRLLGLLRVRQLLASLAQLAGLEGVHCFQASAQPNMPLKLTGCCCWVFLRLSACRAAAVALLLVVAADEDSSDLVSRVVAPLNVMKSLANAPLLMLYTPAPPVSCGVQQQGWDTHTHTHHSGKRGFPLLPA